MQIVALLIQLFDDNRDIGVCQLSVLIQGDIHYFFETAEQAQQRIRNAGEITVIRDVQVRVRLSAALVNKALHGPY